MLGWGSGASMLVVDACGALAKTFELQTNPNRRRGRDEGDTIPSDVFLLFIPNGSMDLEGSPAPARARAS